MRNTKRMTVVALAATMMVGNSLAVFAADNEGQITGSGTTEGHVNKEVQNVVLPTVESGSTPFAYTMDPERLIQGTDAKKYAEGTTFPAAASDTGVYFLTAANTYANTSNTLQAINKSSCDVTLTVKVKATQNSAKDITLATSNTPSSTAAELYLGLKVGNDTEVVSGTEKTVTKTIAGTPGNFEVAVDENNAYVYKEKADASSWKAMNISMTGAVSNYAIEADTTAPTVDVTWSWEKAADGATVDTDAVEYTSNAAPSVARTNYTLTADTALNINVSLGGGSLAATGITQLKNGANALPSDAWSYANGVLTITAARVNSLVNAGVSRTYTIVFNDTAGTTVDITLDGTGN